MADFKGKALYCLAAEPRETIVRIVVLDNDTEVAYETAVLGALRPGYRLSLIHI